RSAQDAPDVAGFGSIASALPRTSLETNCPQTLTATSAWVASDCGLAQCCPAATGGGRVVHSNAGDAWLGGWLVANQRTQKPLGWADGRPLRSGGGPVSADRSMKKSVTILIVGLILGFAAYGAFYLA